MKAKSLLEEMHGLVRALRLMGSHGKRGCCWQSLPLSIHFSDVKRTCEGFGESGKRRTNYIGRGLPENVPEFVGNKNVRVACELDRRWFFGKFSELCVSKEFLNIHRLHRLTVRSGEQVTRGPIS